MPVLTREEVADALKLSIRQVDRLIAEGELRAFRIGSTVRIRSEDLEDYMQSRETIGLDEAALALSLSPASIQQLAVNNEIPHEGSGGSFRFERHALEAWRTMLAKKDRPRVYGNMDSAAKHLQQLLARKGQKVNLLWCELCENEVKNRARAEPWIAGARCAMCGRAACLPHASHWLPTPMGPKKPPVICDDCFDKRQPVTMAASNPRRHKIDGHSARGECLRCAPTYPRPCRKPHCGDTIHCDDGTGLDFDAPPTKGPHCDVCGLPDA
jgi:excisionase family DNA binding protein